VVEKSLQLSNLKADVLFIDIVSDLASDFADNLKQTRFELRQRNVSHQIEFHLLRVID
jgi:hypothetical protein